MGYFVVDLCDFARFRRNRCGLLLGVLCLFILADPHVFGTAISIAFIALGIVAFLALAVWPIRPRRFWLWAFLLFVMVVAEALVEMKIGERWLEPVAYAATAFFNVGVIAALLDYVLDRHPITADKVFGAVSAYVLLAVLFATLFSLLQQVQPGAFHVNQVNEPDGHLGWSDLMYFSFTVLTSTGFGDITPTSHQARSLIVVEQVLGVMYVAFLIARLANMYRRRPSNLERRRSLLSRTWAGTALPRHASGALLSSSAQRIASIPKAKLAAHLADLKDSGGYGRRRCSASVSTLPRLISTPSSVASTWFHQ
jgi:hypothetical protein